MIEGRREGRGSWRRERRGGGEKGGEEGEKGREEEDRYRELQPYSHLFT